MIVCPTQSIVAGDLDDPTSQDLRDAGPPRHQGAGAGAGHPAASCSTRGPTRPRWTRCAPSIAADGMIWADTRPGHPTRPRLGGGPPGHDTGQVVARTAYTTEHPAPWKGKVSAYLVTKAVSGRGAHGGRARWSSPATPTSGAWSASAPLRSSRWCFAAVTGALLIADLRQPRRFALIFLRPQWGSWLVRGAFILAGYGVAGARCGCSAGCSTSPTWSGSWRCRPRCWPPGRPGYTAFLFGQCEGRDLWQTPLLLPILLAQAVAAGAGGAGLAGTAAFDLPSPSSPPCCGRSSVAPSAWSPAGRSS